MKTAREAYLDQTVEALEKRLFGRLVVHVKGTLVVGMRRVSDDDATTQAILKIVNVLRHDITIDDQNAAAVDHDGDHVNRVHLRIGELQRRLATLDIEGEHLGVGWREDVLLTRDFDGAALAAHVVPAAHTDVQIDAHTRQVGHIVLTNVRNEGARIFRQQTRVQRRIGLGERVSLHGYTSQ